MDLDQLHSTLSELSQEPAIRGLSELLKHWKSDESTVTELEGVVERYLTTASFSADSLHAQVFELWSKFRDDAIHPIAGMTMNERLYWFQLLDRFETRPEDKLIIYRKLLARPQHETLHPPVPPQTGLLRRSHHSARSLSSKMEGYLVSKYDLFETTLTEESPLAAALQALGYPVEIRNNGAPLFGFQGDERPERAHIIIRRQYLNVASNDIGFVRGPDGRFQAVLSEYDRGIGFDQKWLRRVHQRYKEQRTVAMARKKGYVFRGREVIQTERGEQIKLLFGAR